MLLLVITLFVLGILLYIINSTLSNKASDIFILVLVYFVLLIPISNLDIRQNNSKTIVSLNYIAPENLPISIRSSGNNSYYIIFESREIFISQIIIDNKIEAPEIHTEKTTAIGSWWIMTPPITRIMPDFLKSTTETILTVPNEDALKFRIEFSRKVH